MALKEVMPHRNNMKIKIK